ncbi:MAG: hypothetical protein WBM84_14260 [Sedimenticolaceae bacterium]
MIQATTTLTRADAWEEIDEFLSKSFENAVKKVESERGPISKSDEEKKDKWRDKLDEALGKAIRDNDSEAKLLVDKMALHFRSALFCAEDSRCNDERVTEYYKKHICGFWQKAKGYIVSMYKDKKWKSERGDLIAFDDKYDCGKIDRSEPESSDEAETQKTV